MYDACLRECLPVGGKLSDLTTENDPPVQNIGVLMSRFE